MGLKHMQLSGLIQMNVSVIIPLYNGERWIEDTIRSVLAQTHSPKEIVVVDDGSTDDSLALVRSSFPEVKVLRNPGEGGKGAGGPRRFGLQHTSAPLVAFLDQDDLWYPDHLRILTRLLRDNNYSAAVAGLDHFQDPSEPRYNLQPSGARPFSPWDRYPLNSIHSPSGVLVRRSALEEIGGWPSQFVISDIHAWFKLTAIAPMLRTSKITVGKREHGDSGLQTLRTEKALFYIRERIRVCEDALAFRKEVTSEREETFQNRLDTFKAISGVLEGAVRGDMQLLKASARFLERESRTGEGMTKALWEFVFWMLEYQIAAADSREQRLILERIIRGWPTRGRSRRNRARSALSQTLKGQMSYKAFLSCALHHPLWSLSSPLFLKSMKVQLRKTSDYFRGHLRTSTNYA